MADTREPERKRQRLAAPDALVLGADSPAKWDFLAPWCEELKGQLVSISGERIRVLGPRSKREKPIRFHWEEEEEEEEEKADPEEEEREIERAVWRTREAVELLSLVAAVDRRAFDMLMTEQCGLRLDDDESEEEEEEFKPMLPGEDTGVVFFLDRGESDEEEEGEDADEEHSEEEASANDLGGDQEDEEATGEAGGQGSASAVSGGNAGDGRREEEADPNGRGDRENAAGRGHFENDREANGEDYDAVASEGDQDGDEDDDLEEHDDVLVLPPDVLKGERRRERETFIEPHFDFISLRGVRVGPEARESPFAMWEKLFLADSPQYQPSAEYKNAKATLLDMVLAGRTQRPQIKGPLEIPISLEFSIWAKSADELASNLMELSTFIKALEHRSQKLNTTTSAKEARECASNFVYLLTQLSMTLSHQDKRTRLFVERLLEVLGSGVPVRELHLYLSDQAKNDAVGITDREITAMLLSGMLIQPLTPNQKLIPSYTNLTIDCADSAFWKFEALCSALATSRAPISKLTLPGACGTIKDDLRGKYWKLVAQTLFHARSSNRGFFSSVRGLSLPDAALTLDDLAEITTALQEKEDEEKIAKQWDICQKRWLLREGTLVHFTEIDEQDRVLVTGDPVALLCDSLVEIVKDNADSITDDGVESEWLNVIIPTYGKCCVSRGSIVTVPSEGSNIPAKSIGKPLTSLSLSFRSDAEGVPGLIKQIGWSLEKLSLSFHREVDVNAMVPTLLHSCPKMTKLSLCESYIDLDMFSSTYENMSGEEAPVIHSLEFQDFYGIGDGEGRLFMKRLGDPTTRLAKHLRELSLLAEEYAEPLQHPTLSELWLALGNNTTLEKIEVMISRTMWSAILKRRLRQFHGQVLPPRPLPLSSKLAFLSVCRPETGSATNASSASQHFDQRVLSLILEFSATRVVRSVKIWS
ncbi:unnamed protein product [Phytophthora fragariaefolia]|uniref:Unnamed protein product n=1 Tax=Phytophthora fragariaefolia TaxID=1490495 RepID=A0A9W6WZZ7_9STRA|nr:unnamed protein product [Phytophthora fragariaefolia]